MVGTCLAGDGRLRPGRLWNHVEKSLGLKGYRYSSLDPRKLETFDFQYLTAVRTDLYLPLFLPQSSHARLLAHLLPDGRFGVVVCPAGLSYRS